MAIQPETSGVFRLKPLPSRWHFAQRLLGRVGVTAILIGASLLVGMAGYHYLEDMAWIDAFANASMILSGMGPMGELHTTCGKLFAGFYALYSGLTVIVATGVILSPVLQRVMHKIHIETHHHDNK